MKMIVGLGNPGSKYKNTRHNVGFFVIDKILEKYNLSLNKEKFEGEYVIVDDLLIAKPLTFMNNSGEFIYNISKFYKINPADIMVIHDEKDFEIGNAQIKISGSSAGHNGIESIIKKFPNNDFKRLRIGIGRDFNIALKDYVLQNFKKEELEKLQNIIEIAADAALSFAFNDIKIVMEKFNVNKKK
ncbi:aminoacyl-tRNA hydrolase [Mycoplasma sp. 1018B]|uniref:aminoacyl-tRNA hydrolase n=1 Tax=Mycoplasma sp. 1018B TaxID=2967302 RepID=UPI00211CAFFF|nr:aminoacyl-tRNA hydrolase [Mycoplasma sp. 1018B]UUM19254.1 aminoacyl-tRNA hydrolase [Mycoplasma sp. 1018B]